MKPIYAHAAAALGLSFAIAGCIPAPEPTPPPERDVAETRPAPAPSPAPAPAPTPTYDNWMDAPQSPGDWSYRAFPGRTEAVFGTDSEAKFLLSCNSTDRRVGLAYPGAGQGNAQMQIRTETTERMLQANYTASPSPGLVAYIGARDPLLDAMALTKGRFAVGATGKDTLYLPAWAEVTRVIEDCR